MDGQIRFGNATSGRGIFDFLSKPSFLAKDFLSSSICGILLVRVDRLDTDASNSSTVRPTLPGREFRLWSDFGTALIQTPNFSKVFKCRT